MRGGTETVEQVSFVERLGQKAHGHTQNAENYFEINWGLSLQEGRVFLSILGR